MFDFIKLCQGSLWSYWYHDDKKEYFYELHLIPALNQRVD